MTSGPVDLRAELAVGRSTFDPGRVVEVTKWIANRPRRIPRLIELLWDEDPGLASRAADVLERVTRTPSPALLRAVAGYKDELIGLLSDAQGPKVQWNLALTLPRLDLTVPECRRVSVVLHRWLDAPDSGSIVRTSALHGIAELTRQNPDALLATLDLLRVAERSGTPAMRARSRILLKKLERPARSGRAGRGLHLFD
jgi:hypothetical protein